MKLLKVISDNKWIFRALIPSLIFCFKKLPLRQAWKCPILLYKSKLINTSGKFILNSKAKFGLVQLGRNRVCIYPNSGIVIDNNGTIIFNGRASIGNASALSVGKTGVLEIGSDVFVTCALKLACYKSIKLENNVLVGWNCMFVDTDFHKLKFKSTKAGNYLGYGEIVVGKGTWIANGCKIYKNTSIPPNCVVGADTILHSKIDCDENTLITNQLSLRYPKAGVYRDPTDDTINYVN